MVSKMYFRFCINHGGRLYIVRITGHVLCLLLLSANGFIPSVLSANLTFLGSSARSRWLSLKSCHCFPSTGFPSFFVPIKRMSVQKFGILRVSEQTPQSLDDGEVPHHQSRNLFERVIVYFFFIACEF
jgi:hypothetical protein